MFINNIPLSRYILYAAMAVILFAHSIPVIIDGSINDFGKQYLDEVGFAPFGIYLAWLIKGSHVISAVLFLINRYVHIAAYVTIFILMMGIVMIHYEEGWFVVGNGRNGMEFNFLMIIVLCSMIIGQKDH